MAQVTVEMLAREIMGSLDMEEGYLIATKWISRRYHTLAAKMRLRHLQRVGEVVVPGVVKVGTVTVVKNSSAVVGVGTGWTAALVGRFFRVANGWYEVLAVPNATTLTLVNTYLEENGSGVGYAIIPRKVALPMGVRQVGQFRNIKQGGYLQVVGLQELDMWEPQRNEIGNGIRYVSEVGYSDAGATQGQRLYEFYPYPVDAQLISFTYFAEPEEFTEASWIPDVVDPGMLKEGAMIDAFRFAMSKALKEGKVDIAAVWRNEMRAQETSWERRLAEAAEADRGSVESSFVLLLGGDGARNGCC
jgi:hypothetical protein